MRVRTKRALFTSVATVALAVTCSVAHAAITNWTYTVGSGNGASWGIAQVNTSGTIGAVTGSSIYYATPGYYTYHAASQWGGAGSSYYGLSSDGLPGGCVDMAAWIQVQEGGNSEDMSQDGCP